MNLGNHQADLLDNLCIRQFPRSPEVKSQSKLRTTHQRPCISTAVPRHFKGATCCIEEILHGSSVFIRHHHALANSARQITVQNSISPEKALSNAHLSKSTKLLFWGSDAGFVKLNNTAPSKKKELIAQRQRHIYTMHFYLFISVFITLSCHVGAQRRDQFSDHQRHILTRSAQWTVVTDVPSDGSIAFPISKPGRLRRPFPRIQVVSSTTKAPLPTELPSRVVIDNKIPVSLFRNKSFNNLEDFMKNLVLQNEYRAASLGSFVPSNTAGEAAITFLRANSAARTGGLAPPANCEPAETPVELERPEDPSLIYFPRCTKVQRCGGCCQHDLLMCVATRSEIINVNVMKARFIPDTNSFQPEGLHPIALEKHLNCECQCRVKAEDCNAIQEYREEECRCICTNENEAKECNGPNKFWDPQTCRCECRNSPDCSTGFFFDEHTCTCQPLRSNGIIFPSRRSGPSNRGHITYDVEKDEIEFLGEEKETTSHSPWFISNVMRANPVNHEEKDKN